MSLVRRLFSIDLRSLALLRIGLASVLLYDLAVFRWPQADLLLSDAGVLPRELFREVFDRSYWSLYQLSSDPRMIRCGLFLEGVAGISLLLGYRTRMACLVCLVLVWSVQARNPLLTTGGDVLLRVLLAWGCLLPLGARFSWDASRRGRRSQDPRWAGEEGLERHFSVASIGICLQVVAMYFFAGIAKWNPYWLQGEALTYCLQFELFVRPESYWLQTQTWALPLITWGTLWLELLCPGLLLSPVRTQCFRGVAMVLFWAMHLGIWMVYSIGIFSLTAMISWMVFIPSSVWSRPAAPSEGERRSALDWNAPANWLGAAMLTYMVAVNLANVPHWKYLSGVRDSLHEMGRWTIWVQEFNMFEEPPLVNPFFVFAGRLADGSQVDLFSGQSPDWRPARQEVFAWGKTQPWRRYWSNLLPIPDKPIGPAGQQAFEKLRRQLLSCWIRHWNATHAAEQQVVSADLECYVRQITAAGSTPPRRQLWARYGE